MVRREQEAGLQPSKVPWEKALRRAKWNGIHLGTYRDLGFYAHLDRLPWKAGFRLTFQRPESLGKLAFTVACTHRCHNIALHAQLLLDGGAMDMEFDQDDQWGQQHAEEHAEHNPGRCPYHGAKVVGWGHGRLTIIIFPHSYIRARTGRSWSVSAPKVMHTGRRFTFTEVIKWTRRDIYWYLFLSIVPTLFYVGLGWKWLTIPWVPIALVGTAVAFITGFKNNASYDRLWEARQIYGAIVNSSRAWGIMVMDFVSPKHAQGPVAHDELHRIHARLIHRHLAWLHALRFQLRQPKAWEHMIKSYNREYRKWYTVDEVENKVDDALTGLITNEEKASVLGKSNPATHVLAMQSKDLRELLDRGLIEDFRHMELEKLIVDLYAQQGKCERIKNFPYPRQFATLNLMFTRLFINLVPFGMLGEFAKLGDGYIWLAVPFSALVAWVFNMMERIGESTENPFEGGANDVPITAITRTIEIDLREMLGETDVPKPLQAQNNILM
ncbi:MAG TPA: bestrophin family ion channel [Flavobacteriales bacterium]|nr:bestrophin family ion channel [Flavobacteriales bacterium]